MKLGVIQERAGQHPVRKLCRTLGVARRAYSAAQKKAGRPRARENVERAAGRQGAGDLRSFAGARAAAHGWRWRGAVRASGAAATAWRGSWPGRGCAPGRSGACRPRTTDSRRLCPLAPNPLAERAQPPTRPGGGWQADGTYVATQEGWLSVAGGLDACRRQIVGWAADDTMPAALVARAFAGLRRRGHARGQWSTPSQSRHAHRLNIPLKPKPTAPTLRAIKLNLFPT